MSDGAHLGIKAGRALGVILGGLDEPPEEERMDVVAFEKWIMDAPLEDPWQDRNIPVREILDNSSRAMEAYSNAARTVAKAILLTFKEDPSLVHTKMDDSPLYEAVNRKYPVVDKIGPTGFQWGWATNAARRCLELEPEPNPALVTIGGRND